MRSKKVMSQSNNLDIAAGRQNSSIHMGNEAQQVLENEMLYSEISDNIIVEYAVEESGIMAYITDIWWERVILHFAIEIQTDSRFDESLPLDFYLVSDKNRANAKLKVKKEDNTHFIVSVNITNPGYCLCLTPASYKIRICQEEMVVCIPSPSVDVARTLPEKSKMFLHNNRRLGYSIEFFISENTDYFEIFFIAQDMGRKKIDSWRTVKKNKRKKRVSTIKKWKKEIKSKTSKHNVIKWAYTHYLIKSKSNQRKNNKKRILFLSEQNEILGGNLECVMTRLKERGLDSEFQIDSSARSVVAKGGYGIRNWFKVMKLVADADYIFVDDHVPFLDWIVLDDKTTLIQLWHAGAGYKSVGYSRWGMRGSPRAFCAHRQYDFGITPGRNIAFFFSEQFGINEEQIIPTGIPRMDTYVDPNHRREVEKKLNDLMPQTTNKKVILFAPTYRGINKGSARYPYEQIDFDGLYNFCDDDYIVLFKMHPWVEAPVPIDDIYSDRLFDISEYPDINDIFYITDILITDYSSSVFEFALMRKPMIFYAFDEFQYMYSRGFHRDYRSACPGKVCNSFDEVMQALKNSDFEEEKIEDYIKYHYDPVDSQATDRVIDWFLLDKMPTEYTDKIQQIHEENERLKKLLFVLPQEDEEDESELDVEQQNN